MKILSSITAIVICVNFAGCKSTKSRLTNSEADLYRAEDRALFNLVGKGYRSLTGQFVVNNCFAPVNTVETESKEQETRKITYIEGAESVFEEQIFGGLTTLAKAYLHQIGRIESPEISEANLALFLFNSPLSQLEHTVLSTSTKSIKVRKASSLELSSRGKEVANTVLKNSDSFFYHECGDMAVISETLGVKVFEIYKLPKSLDQILNKTVANEFRMLNGRKHVALTPENIPIIQDEAIKMAECHEIKRGQPPSVSILELLGNNSEWKHPQQMTVDAEKKCTGISTFGAWIVSLTRDLNAPTEKSLLSTKTISIKTASLVSSYLSESFSTKTEITPELIGTFTRPNAMQADLISKNKSIIYAKINRRAALKTFERIGSLIIGEENEKQSSSLMEAAKSELDALEKYFEQIFVKIALCADKPTTDNCSLNGIERPTELIDIKSVKQF